MIHTAFDLQPCSPATRPNIFREDAGLQLPSYATLISVLAGPKALIAQTACPARHRSP